MKDAIITEKCVVYDTLTNHIKHLHMPRILAGGDEVLLFHGNVEIGGSTEDGKVKDYASVFWGELLD